MVTAAAPRSLYHQLLSSHLQIAATAGVLLCVCLSMIVYFQHGSTTIADIRLPSSMASARVVNGIDGSNSSLRSWVLLGNSARVTDRQQIWSEQIEPAMSELDGLAGDGDIEAMASLRKSLDELRESQWWVEDVAATVGNNPARLIYERNLLPVYDRIQRSVVGLNAITTDSRNVSDIRIAAAVTHQNLSEAVRQLSEVVRTGTVAEVRDFHQGSEAVQGMLTQLSSHVSSNSEARPLLDWILREYAVYEELADRTIAIRQSDAWNRALHILRTETEPLSADVKNQLIALQSNHNGLLEADVSRSALISRVGTIVTASMILGLGAIAWAIARTNSSGIVAPIEALAKASDLLAHLRDRPVQLPVQGPREIAHLTERFNFMSRELLAKTKDLQHANRELQEYTHIITHELKPPLINIKGHAGLIKTQLQNLEAIAGDLGAPEQSVRDAVLESLSRDVPESVDFIDQSMSKMSVLISGVLNNSRLLFRRTSLESVNMNELVEQVVALFSHRFGDVEIRQEALPTIRTDPFLMEHVFSNLIDNALKYLDPGRAGEIVISGYKDEEEAHFFVRDNGIGLEDANTDVFKLFRQADENHKGSGVGLALVTTMLAKLGGRIAYEANDSHGTTFNFCVPLLRGSSVEG